MKHIVTHKGQSHRDEFILVSLLLALYTEIFQVFRRDPTPEELTDPEIFVVDVGQRHEPALNNFDHHQYRGGDCALVMVLKHLGLFESVKNIEKWLTFTNELDVNGPTKTATMFGVSADTMAAFRSPIEDQMLQAFQTSPDDLVRHEVVWIMREVIGKGLLEKIRFVETRIAELKEKAAVVMVGDISGIRSPIEDRPSALLEEYREMAAPTAAFSICPDDRDKGWILYRFHDHPALNFFKLEGNPAILFAHKGGFIAKTRERCEVSECLRLIEQARV
jgi:hypothetical protein